MYGQTYGPQGRASFDPHRHHLDKPDSGSTGDAVYKVLSLPVSQKKNFKFSFFVPIFELEAGQFRPQGHHMNKLGRGPREDARYQISRFYAFQFQ